MQVALLQRARHDSGLALECSIQVASLQPASAVFLGRTSSALLQKDGAAGSALFAHFTRMANSGCPYSTGFPFAASIFTISPDASDSISFMSFMASMMQSTCPAWTMSPVLINGGAPGAGDS